MKKLVCIILALIMAFGTAAFSAFAEDSLVATEDSSVADSSVADSSVADSSVADSSVADSSVADSSTGDSSTGDSSGEDSSTGDDSSGPVGEADIKVTLTVVGEENGTVTRTDDVDKLYAAGENFVFTITPNSDYGVSKVTVNGKRKTVADNGGKVSFPVSGSEDDPKVMEIEVTFSRLVRVYITCVDGEFAVSGYGNGDFHKDKEEIFSKNTYYFWVPAGKTLSFTITPDEGKRIDEVRADLNKLTVKNNKFTLTVGAGNDPHVLVEFVDREEEETYNVYVTIKNGKNGTVKYAGEEIGTGHEIENIKADKNITIYATPKEGYEVKATVNGDEWTVRSGKMTVPVTENMSVVIEFYEEGDEPESSEDDPDSSEATQHEYLDVDDVTPMLIGTQAHINLNDTTRIGKNALKAINEYLKAEGNTLYIGVDGKYQWVIPGGSSFSTGAVVNSGIDFAVTVDKSEYTDIIKNRFQEIADQRNWESTRIYVIERADETPLPAGTALMLHRSAFDGTTPIGTLFQWLLYSPGGGENGTITPPEDAEGITYGVDDTGYVTIENGADTLYGVLSMYVGAKTEISIKYNKTQCKVGYMVNISGDGADVTNKLYWVTGTDFIYTVTPKDGYVFDSISLNKGSKHRLMVLDENGKAITGNEKGKTGRLTIKVNGVSENFTVNVTMAPANTLQKQKDAGNETPWESIILIIVIAITMIGGGVFFVIKWRQGNDDDEYEDDDFDDEDDE